MALTPGALPLAGELQAGVEGIAEAIAAEAQPFARATQVSLQGAHLLFEVGLAFAAALQLLIQERPGAAEGLLLIQTLDLRQGGGQRRRVDALGQQVVELADHHRRQAAQLTADLVGLAHHRVEHRVFRPLRQHEVVAVHLR